MTTESQQQIAREAAEKCVKIANDAMCHHCLTTSLNTVGDFLPDILSAIERATGWPQIHDKGIQSVIDHPQNHAQPQRSEQQEWTPFGKFEINIGAETFTPKCYDTGSRDLILDTHNAALATERQRAEEAEHQLMDYWAGDKVKDDQLRAERQLREQAERELEKLCEQIGRERRESDQQLQECLRKLNAYPYNG